MSTLSIILHVYFRESKTRATGLRDSMLSSKSIISIVVLRYGLDPLKGIAKKLQKRDSDIAQAYGMIDGAMREILQSREKFDQVWEEWFAIAHNLAENLGTTLKMPRTSRMMKNRSNVPAENPEQYFKRSVGVPFMDNLSSELLARFSTQNRKFAAIMSLVPAALVNIDDVENLKENLLF